MATPLTGLGHRNGGGVAVMAASLNAVDPSPPKPSSLNKNSPILIFLFFHKAVKAELEALHRAAIHFATNQGTDITPLLDRYHFLRSIYRHHCNAEDEVEFLLVHDYCFIVCSLLFCSFQLEFVDFLLLLVTNIIRHCRMFVVKLTLNIYCWNRYMLIHLI
ncbi:unnamed protein product [Amaranthus hypochondriacus]